MREGIHHQRQHVDFDISSDGRFQSWSGRGLGVIVDVGRAHASMVLIVWRWEIYLGWCTENECWPWEWYAAEIRDLITRRPSAERWFVRQLDAWHDGDDPRPLHEFLGLSRDEWMAAWPDDVSSAIRLAHARARDEEAARA